jgi:uncharacterized protein
MRMFRLEKVAGKGRGLVASRTIPAGTLVERAPAVRLPAGDRALIEQSALFPHTFADPASYATQEDYGLLVVFGQLTFCNHSESPNAAVRWEDDEIATWAMLEATRDIASGSEITLYYTNIDQYSAADLFI